MALLAGLASTTLRSHIDLSQLEQALQQLVLADAHARRQATNSAGGEVDLRIDGDALLVSPNSRRFTMPDALDLSLERGANAIGSGERIRFSDSGRSSTYAIRIELQDDVRWLVVLGATGQRFSTSDVNLVRRLLQ